MKRLHADTCMTSQASAHLATTKEAWAKAALKEVAMPDATQ